MPQKSKPAHGPIHLDGAVWMMVGGESLGGRGRGDLLRAIAENGSITQAAKAIGMSYKAAWDAVAAMTNLAGEALVERSSGGRGGGSTRLPARGRRLIERFDQIEAVQHQNKHKHNNKTTNQKNNQNQKKQMTMKTSARNQFSGAIT